MPKAQPEQTCCGQPLLNNGFEDKTHPVALNFLRAFTRVEKPRVVSLLPCIHPAIVPPEMLRAGMHQVFAEAKDSHYRVIITGSSRTADIEWTVTLGAMDQKICFFG